MIESVSMQEGVIPELRGGQGLLPQGGLEKQLARQTHGYVTLVRTSWEQVYRKVRDMG
jgi:hypothetical protein